MVEFATNPVVIPFLLGLGLVGLTIELLLPGRIVPGLIGAACLGLYFYGHIEAGHAGWEAGLLFAAGLVMLIAEVFITAFGIIGVLGVISLSAGVMLAAEDPMYAAKMLLIAIVLAGLTAFVIFKYFSHLGMWNRLVLEERQDKADGYIPATDQHHLLHRTGRAVTPLRPAGTVVIGEQRYDVVSEGAWLPAETEVEVVLVEGTRIVVRKTVSAEAERGT